MVTPYTPKYIKAMSQGLVQDRVNTIIPEDAYPVLENAWIFREKILRRQGLQFLGRLQRNLTSITLTGQAFGATAIYADILANGAINLRATEPNAQIVPGSVSIVVGAITFSDSTTSNGTLVGSPNTNFGDINYSTGRLSLSFSPSLGIHTDVVITFSYYPSLPVMGARTQDTNSSNTTNTILFDTKYAYIFGNRTYSELPSTTPTTWTGTNADFFWSTNYWVDSSNPPNKLFWATNSSGPGGDPIRYYNSITWTDFAPQIDAAGNLLTQCLAFLPFRGRLVCFNTLEGMNLGASTQFFQRVRWSAIGSPLTGNSWRDDIRGQGGFLDIPTSENITAVGFVRDNLVIYCQQSTWQLRYTGRTIAPFQIERVNSELGAYSLFSAVQFDTSLVGIGDKGVVECDSYKSERIDIKIPDLVFNFSGDSFAQERIQGIRDIQQRVAYWTYVYNGAAEQQTADGGVPIYPNRRLIYNYENDSWAIFTDSLTALGTYQLQTSDAVSWEEATWPWEEADYPWVSTSTSFPAIIGGNQQGFVMLLSSNLMPVVSNQQSLTITNIVGHSATGTATVITCPSHNLINNKCIMISGIPTGTPFDNLNGGIFFIQVINQNSFGLYNYIPASNIYLPQLDAAATYIGSGVISIRDGFNITSKKFNNLEIGENIQMGYLDLLLDATDDGAFTMNIYINYADGQGQAVNVTPQNQNAISRLPDDFFNSIIPTSQGILGGITGSKYMYRATCPVRGAMITIQFTLSNTQLMGVEQQNKVGISTQILWVRPCGRLQTY